MKITLSLLLAVLTVISANGSDRQPIGELGPHWDGERFHYVGDFHKNYLYLIGDEEGNFGGRLADDQYFADAYIIREDVQMLLRDPKSGRFAVIDLSDPASRATKEADLKFHDVPATSIPAKAWKRAVNPKDYAKDTKKGKEKSWIYVDLTARPGECDQFYVGTEIQKDPKTGYSVVALLIVNEQRTTLHFDPKNKRFASVRTNLLAMPLEEPKYEKMVEGGAAEAALKVIQDKIMKKPNNSEQAMPRRPSD